MTGSLWCPEMMNIYYKLPFCRWGNSLSMEEGTYPVSLQLMCKHLSEASCLLGRERGGNEFIEHLLTSAWAMSCTRRTSSEWSAELAFSLYRWDSWDPDGEATASPRPYIWGERKWGLEPGPVCLQYSCFAPCLTSCSPGSLQGGYFSFAKYTVVV